MDMSSIASSLDQNLQLEQIQDEIQQQIQLQLDNTANNPQPVQNDLFSASSIQPYNREAL